MFRGLKTHIVIYLAALLVAAMFLIDFIVVTSAQRMLLDAEAETAEAFIAHIELLLGQTETESLSRPNPTLPDMTPILAAKTNVTCLQIVDDAYRPVYSVGHRCRNREGLLKLMQTSIESRSHTRRYDDETWGVFWKQKRTMHLTRILKYRDSVRGAIGIEISLDDLYGQLRNLQNIIVTYIAVNTVLLTLIGYWGLSRVTVRPIQRLVKRTDAYNVDDGEVDLLYEKDTDEYSRLARSLHRMLNRISRDKQKLQTTILSLEKVNEELQNAQEDIVRAEKLASIGRLTAGIAHEIGNPIGIILGYLELLQQEDLPGEEKQEFLRRAGEEINRINAILHQLLEFSRQSETEYNPVSLHQIITELSAVCHTQPFLSHVDLDLRLEAQNDTVLGDANQIRQVFLNLIINAADAIAASPNASCGRLTIESANAAAAMADAPESTRLVVSFRDNGEGIPLEHLPNIFDPFFTTKEPGKGTGLGLSVSYRIVRDMGGILKADSRRGEGACFTALLPVIEDASVPQPDNPRKRDTGNGH